MHRGRCTRCTPWTRCAAGFHPADLMARPVRARRLTDEEGRTLLRIVRRGRHGTIKVRRAMMILTSSSGNTNEAIAALVAADPDTARGVIHAFNDHGLDCLEPRRAGGAPRRITDADEAYIVREPEAGPPAAHRSPLVVGGMP